MRPRHTYRSTKRYHGVLGGLLHGEALTIGLGHGSLCAVSPARCGGAESGVGRREMSRNMLTCSVLRLRSAYPCDDAARSVGRPGSKRYSVA
jgi:hypothetical protein